MRYLRRVSWRVILVALSGALSACAPAQPVLELNPHLQAVGDQTARRDIRACRREVRSTEPQTIQPPLSPPIGAVGPATNGVVIGSAAPPHRIWESEDAYRQAVEHCLRERGYQIAGWQ